MKTRRQHVVAMVIVLAACGGKKDGAKQIQDLVDKSNACATVGCVALVLNELGKLDLPDSQQSAMTNAVKRVRARLDDVDPDKTKVNPKSTASAKATSKLSRYEIFDYMFVLCRTSFLKQNMDAAATASIEKLVATNAERASRLGVKAPAPPAPTGDFEADKKAKFFYVMATGKLFGDAINTDAYTAQDSALVTLGMATCGLWVMYQPNNNVGAVEMTEMIKKHDAAGLDHALIVSLGEKVLHNAPREEVSQAGEAYVEAVSAALQAK